MKRIVLALLLTFIFTYPVYAQTVYERTTVQQIYTGLTYEQSRRVTTNGLLDVHVLTVDLAQQHLAVHPMASTTENGLKENLLRLMENSGAAAGINGDFFGMGGSHGAALGLEIIDGRITSANESFNNEVARKSATFFVDNNNMPFLDYIQTDLRFLNNGQENIKLTSYNIYTDWNCYLDRSAGETTADFDARFPGKHKIVVENDVITYISQKGETVTIPENGYVITVTGIWADSLERVAVGHRAEVQINSSVDFSRISAAISGGGKILSGGLYVDGGMIITGRQPRSAIGISADKQFLILMVVDGRSHSIGATHSELAALLREYGAFDAMHLDGGGSSTIAVSESLKPASVKNMPSDGAQRRIINGLGVFNNSVMSEPVAIEVETSDFVFAGVPSPIYIYAVDRYLNRTELKDGFVVDSGDGGYFANGYFYPTRTGFIQLTVHAGNMSASKLLRSEQLAELMTAETVRLPIGGEHNISVSGKSIDGHIGSISRFGTNVEIQPPDIAKRDPDDPAKIIGMSAGVGFIKYSVGNVVKYSRLVVGTSEAVVESLSPNGRALSYIAYPEGNAGSVSFVEGLGLELAYQMAESNDTQAAYIAFDEPLVIPGEPMGLKLSVFGDNSGNWLRGRVSDANSTAHFIDFARYIDWEGQQIVEARIPDNVAYPIQLERIYVAALENTELEMRKLYFTGSVVAVYPINIGDLPMPQSTEFVDFKSVKLGEELIAFTDILLLGDIVSEANPNHYKELQDKAKAELFTVYGQSFGIFYGDTDNIAAQMPVFRKRTGTHDRYQIGGVDIISLTIANGNMFSSNAEQWQSIEENLYSAGNNILVLFDRNPLKSMPAKERELLQRLFVESGKNIIVASCEGMESSATVTNGVRYINLAQLFHEDGSVNEEFRALRIRFYENDFKYFLG